MSTEYCLAAGTAAVRRADELTLLVLDGRPDPQPVVVRGSGVEICDALESWTSLDEIVAAVDSRHVDTPTAEIEVAVRTFVDGMCGLGVVTARAASKAGDRTEHAGR